MLGRQLGIINYTSGMGGRLFFLIATMTLIPTFLLFQSETLLRFVHYSGSNEEIKRDVVNSATGGNCFKMSR